MRAGYFFVDTQIGKCAIVFRGDVVLGIHLPDQTDAAQRRLRGSFPDLEEVVPTQAMRGLARDLARLSRGESVDLSYVTLDMHACPAFHRRVYEALRRIPCGQTISYGALAARAGSKGAARAVGQAMQKNPFALVVPCHRVLGSDGLGGFSAAGGGRRR